MDLILYFPVLILCMIIGLGTAGMLPEDSLSSESYHVCDYTEIKNVTKMVAYQKPNEMKTKCGGWIPWRLCTQTYYVTEYRSINVQEAMSMKHCCEGYEQVGHYCALSFDRSSEFTSRPGVCPADKVKESNNTCTFDIDCPGLQKCCQFSNTSVCSTPIPEGRHNDGTHFWYNVTVLVKMEFERLSHMDPQFLNHTRLLHSMITGALCPLNCTIHHISTAHAETFTTKSQILIGLREPASLDGIFAKLKDIVMRLPEVINIKVEDVDECSLPELNTCSSDAFCTNVEGSYCCYSQHAPPGMNTSQPGKGCKDMMGSPPWSTLKPCNTTSLPLHGWSTVSVLNTNYTDPACYCSEITDHRIFNVTSDRFQMSWGINSSLHHIFQVDLVLGPKVVNTTNTTAMKIEFSELKVGKLYTVFIRYQDCEGHAHVLEEYVKTAAETFTGSLRITNYEFIADYNDTSSSKYQELTRNLIKEIEDSLSETIPRETLKVEILSLSPGSIVAKVKLLIVPGRSPVNITRISRSLLFLNRSKMFEIDPLQSSIQDADECTSPLENDCSAHAQCINRDGSFTCSCIRGYQDVNLNRPGRNCEGLSIPSTTDAPKMSGELPTARSMTSVSHKTTSETSFAATKLILNKIISMGMDKTTTDAVPIAATEMKIMANTSMTTENSSRATYPRATSLKTTKITSMKTENTSTEAKPIAPAELITTDITIIENVTAGDHPTVSLSWLTPAHEPTTDITNSTGQLPNSTFSTLPATVNHTDYKLSTTTSNLEHRLSKSPSSLNESLPVTAGPSVNTPSPAVYQSSTGHATSENTTTINGNASKSAEKLNNLTESSTLPSSSATEIPPTVTSVPPVHSSTKVHSTSVSSNSTSTLHTSVNTMVPAVVQTSTATQTSTSSHTLKETSKGKDISLKDNVKVECLSKSIWVTVKKTFLNDVSINESALYLGQSECKMNRTSNDEHVVLSVEFSESCIELQPNKTHIMVSTTLQNTIASQKTSLHKLNSTVTCAFKNDILTSSGISPQGVIPLVDSIQGDGSFTPEFKLFSGDVAIGKNDTLDPNDDVLIEVGINTADQVLKVVVTECWATPTSSTSDPNRHAFINGSCALTNTNTAIRLNGEDKVAKFTTKVFAIIDAPVVYLHCKLHICKESPERTCKPDCTGGRSARSSEEYRSHYASFGPLCKATKSSPKNKPEESTLAAGYVVLILLAIFAVIAAVASVVIYRYYRRTGRYDFKPKCEKRGYSVFSN